MTTEVYALDHHPGLDQNLREYLRRRLAYTSATEAAEEQRKEYDQRIISILNGLGVEADTFEIDIHEGTRVRIRKSVRSGGKYLSYDKLLALGVTPDILDKAWEVRRDSQPFIVINYVKSA